MTAAFIGPRLPLNDRLRPRWRAIHAERDRLACDNLPALIALGPRATVEEASVDLGLTPCVVLRALVPYDRERGLSATASARRLGVTDRTVWRYRKYGRACS